jgi:hypothetical protein
MGFSKSFTVLQNITKIPAATGAGWIDAGAAIDVRSMVASTLNVLVAPAGATTNKYHGLQYQVDVSPAGSATGPWIPTWRFNNALVSSYDMTLKAVSAGDTSCGLNGSPNDPTMIGYFVVDDANAAQREIIKIVDYKNATTTSHIVGGDLGTGGFLYSHVNTTPLRQGYWHIHTLPIYSACYLRFVVNNNWWTTSHSYQPDSGVASFIYASVILNQVT